MFFRMLLHTINEYEFFVVFPFFFVKEKKKNHLEIIVFDAIEWKLCKLQVFLL